jgi:hypothetical protein
MSSATAGADVLHVFNNQQAFSSTLLTLASPLTSTGNLLTVQTTAAVPLVQVKGSGQLQVHSGGLYVNAGGVQVNNGGITSNQGLIVSNGGLDIVGTTSVTSS